jgi:SnoaL-like domain
MDYEELELQDKRLEAIQVRLDRLEAERRIAHVMYRYVHACDALKDAEIIASFFTEDAVWEGRGRFAEFGSTVGREAIREMFANNPTILPFTAHFLTNPVIVLSQDGEHGWGEWHTLEAATLRDNAAQVWILARYDNDFALVGDDWKIKHIRYTDTCVVPYEEGWLKARYVSPLTLKKESSL